MKVKELEIVELTADLPAYGLVRGARGTVVEVFETPEEAYMVEFVDASGQSSIYCRLGRRQANQKRQHRPPASQKRTIGCLNIMQAI